ncbi:MAG: hypothetical protein P4L82_10825 [Ancalomicrobiaceae bacterium]|nr:hypothetical protein [Ancalomicrobiaceae bacterium]
MGAPDQVAESAWACPVPLHGLHDGLADVRGVDFWQAMQLAKRLMADVVA